MRDMPRNGQTRRMTWTTVVGAGVVACMEEVRRGEDISWGIYASALSRGDIQYNADVPTVWVRFGDWLAILAMIGAVGALAAPGTRAPDSASVGERGSGGFAPSR